MPIQLNELMANTRTVAVPYMDMREAARVTYQPSVLTPSRESKIRNAAEDGDNYVMLETLAELIVEWDVMETKDKALPHTVEVLDTLPSSFLTAIFNAIREDMTPNPRSARGSFAR